jgi:hypothetical protein
VHISDSVCLTDGADDPDKSCVFPFEFYGTIYNECTWEAAYDDKAWCSTEVDSDGRFVQGKWGDCSLGCPISKEGKPCGIRTTEILTKG